MTFEAFVEFERESFTNHGPSPRLAAWIIIRDQRRVGTLPRKKALFQLGGEVTVGIRPLRFGWNGIWKYVHGDDLDNN
jgi:hypothetical protein